MKRHTSGGFESFLYSMFDQILILFTLSPFAIMVWRGSWSLLDLFLFPEDPLASAWFSVSVGYSFIAATFVFIECKNKEWRLFEKCLEWKMFMYPLSFAVLHAWRGCWMLMDHYLPTNGVSLLSSHFGSVFVLSISKTISNSMFIPAFFASDRYVTPFQIGTAFGTATSDTSPFYKLLDYAFTMSVITVSTVTFWRSSWTAINIYVFPNHATISNMLSIVAGYTVILSLKMVERSLKSMALRSSKAVGLLLQCIFAYLMGLAAVNLWRGVWQLMDIFLFPDYPVLVGFASHGLGMFILYLGRGVVNLVGCPCGTRVDSLETFDAFDTTIGTIVPRPTNNQRSKKPRHDFSEKKQLVVVSTSSCLGKDPLKMVKIQK